MYSKLQTGNIHIQVTNPLRLEDQEARITQKSDLPGAEQKNLAGLSQLQRINQMQTSKQFLEECTYYIGLTDLYQFHSSCYYNETMPYCPVLVKIVHEEIKQCYNGASYLLQVWKRGGKKVYEVALNSLVKVWSISYQHFLYQPAAGDENSDYIHIVDFSNYAKVHLIRNNFADQSCKIHLSYLHIDKFLTYSNNAVYIGSHNNIKYISVDLQNNNGIIEVNPDDVLNIKLENENGNTQNPCKLLALLAHKFIDKTGQLALHASIITCIESVQSIVDYSFLNVRKSESVNSNHKYEYALSQYREIIQDKNYTKPDRIFKFEAVISAKNQFVVAVAQKESGSFDVYYNAFRVSQSGQATVSNVELTFDTLYLDMKNDPLMDPKQPVHGKKERVRALHAHWENKMNFQNSEYDEHYTMKNIFFQRIKNHCKLFNSFNLLGTVLGIAHGKMISIFSILSQKWTNHFVFNSEIVALFRSAFGSTPQITILLADNSLKVIYSDRALAAKRIDDSEVWVEDKTKHLDLPKGKITHQAFDFEDNKWVLFLIKVQKDNFKLVALTDNKIYDITDQIKKFGQKTNIFFLYSVCENTEFIMQYGKKVKLYEILMEEDVPEEELKRREQAKLEIENNDDLEDDDDKQKQHDKKEEQKVYPFRPVVHLKQKMKIPQIQHECGAGVKFRLHKSHENEDDGTHVHKEHLFLIIGDYNNFYKIELETLECKVFEHQNTVGIYFSDKNYLYTLSHRSETKRAGFRLYDIENVVEQNKDYSYTLSTDVQVGCQGYIDFSPATQRIVFQASYEKIEVVPILHRNTINFIGMRPRNYFIATRVIDGYFYALSIKGKLYGWDMITGKMIETNAPMYKELADYEVYQWDKEKIVDLVYQKEWYNKILLRKKSPIPNFDDKAYYSHLRDHSIKGQISYLDMQAKQFYDFKVIEIVSSKEVKIHFNFVHPFYNNIQQFIYFSNDLTYMYERLKYDRQFLYIRKDDNNGNVTWMFQHRFNEVPNDLLHITQYPFIFSPGFTKYIDIDNSHTHFIIRDTLKHEQKICDIPLSLMSSQGENLEDVAKRFKWVDEETILVINSEGIERLVDVTQGFEEIAFNAIPLYNNEVAKSSHYIVDQADIHEEDTFKRLQKKYQAYKSAYYLQNKRDVDGKISSYNLYQSLFSIDYRIENCTHRYVADMSFTFLHWSLMEQLKSGKLSIEQIDLEQVEHLFYNILPGGNTILHNLHDKGELLEKIMRLAHFNDDKAELVIHVPFLQNMEEKSPIHLCVENTEYRYINMFLEYLQHYDIDHHSRAISSEYHIMVEHDLPNLIPYMESRVLQTGSIKKITKGMLKVTNKHHVCASSLWHSQQDIDQLLQPAPIEQDIKLSFLDVPGLHDFNTENGINFFEQLAETQNMKLFETHGIKKLIEFKWPLIFKYTLLKLFVPFLIYLTLYMTLMHSMVYVDGKNYYYYPLMALIIVFSIYFLVIETYQMVLSGFAYFTSFWNYLDYIPPVMLLVFFAFIEIGHFDDRNLYTNDKWLTVEASMQATLSLMLWMKMLYFLRIFKTTGYLVRIIIEVIVDMRHFLFILLLTFIAFGDAIYNINTSNTEPFISGGYIGSIVYIYRMSLGDFMMDEAGGEIGSIATTYIWILFMLCTIFNLIIMLNLLIAIISESFARINEEKEQAGYQEKAAFISENLYLVPKSQRNAFCPQNRYLLFAVDAEEELAEYVETVDDKLAKLKKDIFQNNKKVVKKIVDEMFEYHNEVMKVLKPETHGHHGATNGHDAPAAHGHH